LFPIFLFPGTSRWFTSFLFFFIIGWCSGSIFFENLVQIYDVLLVLRVSEIVHLLLLFGEKVEES
jgi:hypothetical protein